MRRASIGPGDVRVTTLRGLAALALALAAVPARGAGRLTQEQRLAELSAHVSALPSSGPSGAPRSDLPELEAAGLPDAAGLPSWLEVEDRSAGFPRGRLRLDLPIAGALHASADLAALAPLPLHGRSTHLATLSAGLRWAAGALEVALRGVAVQATSRALDADPAWRDALRVRMLDAALVAGYALSVGAARVTPYAGLGLVRLDGRLTAAGARGVLTDGSARPVVEAGLRGEGWRLEATADSAEDPARPRELIVRLAWIPGSRP